MAGVALRVRIEACGNRERNAATRGRMAARAVSADSGVLRVVKRDAKTAQGWKTFDRRA